ncbi:MAG: DUF4132 domain-containing protein [Pirellulaceae bacterium]|nr:DUF4132 domain-containing protein [Pirellulaceae bacterium]
MQPETNEAQNEVSRLVDELVSAAKDRWYSATMFAKVPAAVAILKSDPQTQLSVVMETIHRVSALRDTLGKPKKSPEFDARYLNLHHEKGFPNGATVLMPQLLRRKLPWTEDTLVDAIDQTARLELVSIWNLPYVPSLVKLAEKWIKEHGLSAALRQCLDRLRTALEPIGNAAEQRLAREIVKLCEDVPNVYLAVGEAWSDAALADLGTMDAKRRAAWNALLVHCQAGGKGKFTEKWRKSAVPLIDAVSFDSLKETLLRWFPLVDKPRTHTQKRRNEWEPDFNNLIIDPHVELLRGLVWCCGLREDGDLARALARLALSAYRKVPGKGPRLVSLGNACITALGMMPGKAPIGQLALLKVKVKFGTAQREIEKAFNAAAQREGLPRDEIEELAVPSYGLEEVGAYREQFGDYRAELLVDGSSAAIHWSKDGKPLKSVPAEVRKELAEEYKELQATLKDINAMLPAQRERMDSLFLAQRSWPLALWRERYLDHPLIGTIARRLIWTFTANKKTSAGIWWNDGLVDAADKPLRVAEDAAVTLWHPIGHSVDAILAWREWLERHEVVQPFKQAHREVYVLTDAERSTEVYSNRFAAHILRQHQFNALCLARGWKNKLRLMVDDTYPPAHRMLPQWNLRAEFWIEGIGENYGTDTNEAGVFLYLTTDQVRFYPIEAAQLHAHAGGGGYTDRWNPTGNDDPVRLEQIPPLVFSEIMRDVDLFVGVASVGNDPNWSDGGPGGAYREYWQSYSFGELSATAQTRRALLERLIPRLKIADRCTLAERFLIVRGSIRTYKIHLGSGNILMEPNDQYLCIVPKQTVSGTGKVYLPFEGDGMLSIILSKAFLLADDQKITDSTITSQLRR